MQSKRICLFSLVSLCTATFLLSDAYAQGAAANAPARPQIDAKPIALDWKSVKWPSLDYARVPIEGGAALYTLASPDARKFRIEMIFASSLFSVPEKNAVAFEAATDLVLLGGAGKRSFEQLQRELQDRGIKLATYSKEGKFALRAEGLTSDFDFALSILEDIALRPRFDANALDLWKQEKADDFDGMLDASTLRVQYAFIAQEANRAGLGANHYLTNDIVRRSKKVTAAVSYEDVKRIAQSFRNRNGLNVILSGTFTEKNQKNLLDSMLKIPRGTPIVESWLPGRSNAQPNDKVKVVIIDKPDMSQAAVTVRYYLTRLGSTNRLEKARLDLLEEVFSSSGGVVGNDRFSKAMRADSGISYSSHSDFRMRYVYPNNGVGVWVMNYQSPNERIFESVELALKTANDFLQKGILQGELERTRIARMNAMLSREETIFDKASRMSEDIVRNRIPQPTPIETLLARYDQEVQLHPVNEALSRIRDSHFVPVLVLMGHPSAQTIQRLKSDKRFDVMRVIAFDEFKKDLM